MSKTVYQESKNLVAMLWLDCRIRVWGENGAVKGSGFWSFEQQMWTSPGNAWLDICVHSDWVRLAEAPPFQSRQCEAHTGKTAHYFHLKPNYNCNHWVFPMPKISFSHLPLKYINVANSWIWLKWKNSSATPVTSLLPDQCNDHYVWIHTFVITDQSHELPTPLPPLTLLHY